MITAHEPPAEAVEAACRAVHPTRWEYRTIAHPCEECATAVTAAAPVIATAATARAHTALDELAHERDEARQQLADLRAGIEALLPGETVNVYAGGGNLVSQRRVVDPDHLRTLLAGSGEQPGEGRGPVRDGPEHYDRVWHMGRLVLAEDAPRNSESRLIGQSLRAIQTEHPETWAVLTYAAQSAGHVGYVYQATNAIYTGLGGDARGFSLVDADGRIYGTTGVNKAQAAARGLTVVPEPRKHRYLYVLGNKTQRRERMKLLRLPTLPYPKEVPSWQPEEADDDR